jgi:hypothetical protein
MVSIGKRAGGIAAAVALIATVGPVAVAGAQTAPAAAPVPLPVPAPVVQPAGPVVGAFQAGTDAAVGGLNAGTQAAVGGWNAGAAALGLPFQFTAQTSGPLGLQTPAVAPLVPTQ